MPRWCAGVVQRWIACAACLVLASAGALAEGAAVGSSSSASPPVRFYVDSTRAEVGKARVIAFAVDPADEDRTWQLSAADGAPYEVLMQPAALAGQPIGYLRIRGTAEGQATLSVAGTKIDLDIAQPRIERTETPRFINPQSGAVVWGEIGVGFEFFAPEESGPLNASLELDDGRSLDLLSQTGPENGVWRRFTFDLDSSSMPPGWHTMTAIVTDSAGVEHRSAPVTVRIVSSLGVEPMFFEAETKHEIEEPPRRFRNRNIRIVERENASGGKFVNNSSPQPAVCIPVEIESDGMYQMIVRAGGSHLAGAYPTIGIYVDDSPRPVTNGRLTRGEWHRTTVGVPFRLEAGTRLLAPYFLNDFFVRKGGDRNLSLDSIELLKVADAGGASSAGDSMMGGMDAMGAMGNTMAPPPSMGAMEPGGGSAMNASSMGAMDSMAAGAPMMSGTPSTSPSENSSHMPASDPMGERDSALRVGIDTPLEGRTIAGDLRITPRVWWDGSNTRPAPLCSWLLNGEVIDTQRSGHPWVIIDAARFTPGPNTIQLVAQGSSGQIVASTVQTVHRPSPVAIAEDIPARFARFSIHDPAWEHPDHTALLNERGPREGVASKMSRNGQWRLALPSDLQGGFDIWLDARGEQFDGPPILDVLLETPDGTKEIAGQKLPGSWGPHKVSESVILPGGEQAIILRFANDKYEKGKGDRNAWLQALALKQNDSADRRMPPMVQIDFPPAGERVAGAMQIFGRVADDEGVRYISLLKDGKPLNITANFERRTGDFALPVSFRGLAPGEHTFTIRAVDVAGIVTDSADITVNVAQPDELDDTRYGRAVTLLDRLGFGSDPVELRAILTMGESKWLRDRLGRQQAGPGERAAVERALAVYPSRRNDSHASRRSIAQIIATPNPVRTRFAMWAQNHFSTWVRKVNGDRKWDEHVRFTELGAAPFGDLVLTSATSPAMLRYLDQDRSYLGRINENYAREIMELHTLGVDGGYTQEDVTELSTLITGWTTSHEGDGFSGGDHRFYTFRFDPRLNPGKAHTVAGMRFDEAGPAERYDRVRKAIEMMVAHPSTAQHISRKLAEHYVGVPAPNDLVLDLTRRFHETNGDMAELVITLTEHPAFWERRPERLSQPLEYAIRITRASDWYNPGRVGGYLQLNGFDVFDRAMPDGYPEDDMSYADSNGLIQRWKFAHDARHSINRLIPSSLRNMKHKDADADIWNARVIDTYAITLTGRPLAIPSFEAAMRVMRETKGSQNDRVFALAMFLPKLPELNLK